MQIMCLEYGWSFSFAGGIKDSHNSFGLVVEVYFSSYCLANGNALTIGISL